MKNCFYDPSNVRYELVKTGEGKPYNWLFLPGGPGVNSCYFHRLIDILKLPGNIWFVDLPGNGDNIEGIPSNYNYDQWMDLFLPTITRFENPIIVGHSFGGMFPLLFPELEKYLKGFVILNATPGLWHEEAVSYAKQFNHPDYTGEMIKFMQNPNTERFKAAIGACMPYYFPKESLEEGRAYLAPVTIQYPPAMWWQQKAVEINFSPQWIPEKVPTLIIGGKYDCICPFIMFQKDHRFHRPNIQMHYFEDTGHLGWVENPQAIRNAFDHFIQSNLN